jgi:hypothetical protein
MSSSTSPLAPFCHFQLQQEEARFLQKLDPGRSIASPQFAKEEIGMDEIKPWQYAVIGIGVLALIWVVYSMIRG